MTLVALRELRKCARLVMVIRQYGDSCHEEFVEAEPWRRFLHAPIDGIVLVFVAFIHVVLYIMVWDIRNEQYLWFAIVVSALLIRILYYQIFESIWGATPAKFLLGTVVKDQQGEKPTFRQILRRTCTRFIPFEAWSFFTYRGWHDRWSNTYVCKEEIRLGDAIDKPAGNINEIEEQI